MAIINTPFRIGNLVLHNRLVFPPMASGKADEEDMVSQEISDYYNQIATGGNIGLIVMEHSYISIDGKAGKRQVSISRDSDVEGLGRLVSVIHQNGSKTIAQINHAGSAASREITGSQPMSASAFRFNCANPEKETPRQMTLQDIEKLIDNFAQAARRSKEAGFNGVEIHSAHGYLLNQFYSPLSNKRTDEYAGTSLSGRIKLHLEVIRAIRNMVGDDYLIALRLGACDYMDGGSTLEDSIDAALAFQDSGVNLLDVSGGFCSYVRPGVDDQGYFAELTGAIKKHVSIPVILTGGITQIESAERLLEEGKADLIGVGRAMLRDSQWAHKAIASFRQ